MKEILKKVLLISAISIVSFPVILISLMFFDGQLRIEKGPKQRVENQEVKTLKYSPIQDSLSVVHTKTFEALVNQQKQMEEEQRILEKREERLRLVENELGEKSTELDEQKKIIESVIKSSETLEDKRVKALAKIYGSMRADEAASILETMPDRLIISILKGIAEDRQKAKILGKMNKEKARKISEDMGAPVFKGKAADNPTGTNS
jgi:flagellar motility protein MotE (MotC chaperone)